MIRSKAALCAEAGAQPQRESGAQHHSEAPFGSGEARALPLALPLRTSLHCKRANLPAVNGVVLRPFGNSDFYNNRREMVLWKLFWISMS